MQNSPVFNYINSLSPIKPVRSLPIAQTITNSSKDVSSFAVGEEALHETEPPQVLKNECTTTTPPRVSNDGETDLLKMCDGNVKQKSETPDWEAMISDSSEILIYDSTNNDSEAASTCFLERSSSDSKTRSLGVVTKSTSEPVMNSNDALHCGVRRRCLDFEMPRNSDQTSVATSSRCVVPSPGLHFNAIAMSSQDNNVGNDTKVGLQGSITPVLKDSMRGSETGEDAGQGAMRKFGQAGEGVSSCKRCNCKRSKCLKLYCECFAAGVYCIGPCSCIDCFNKPIHEDTIMATRKQIESRNPLAFAPKVIKNSDSIIIGVGDNSAKTPASARHKRGCNCKKSNCLKKYCECYQSGVGCSINCRCEGCKNAFGKMAGSSFTSMDKENETSGEGGTEKPPSTPMPLRQPLAQLPISSNNMLLTHQHLHGASGSS
ncbi:hypothetical protein Bca101_083277 [Brassica carinata]